MYVLKLISVALNFKFGLNKNAKVSKIMVSKDVVDIFIIF